MDDRLVSLRIMAFQVVKQAATAAHHHEQAAAGRVVLLVGLEVLRQLTDPFAEDCDLYLGTSGVRRMCTVLVDDFSFSLAG